MLDRRAAHEARIRGSLLGLAWGDVLGCPIEFWTRELIAEVFGHYQDLPAEYPLARIPREPRIFGHLRPLGAHSDDTQQALALIHVGKAPHGWRTDRWAEVLVAGEARGAWRGTGKFFRASVQRLASGAALEEAGSPSAGVGAAMRVAPIAALLRDDAERLRDVVFESSCVTHADVRAAALAYAVAASCWMLIDGASATDVQQRLPTLVHDAEASWPRRFPSFRVDYTHLHAVSDTLRALLATRHEHLEHLQQAILANASPHLGEAARASASVNDPFALIGGVHALSVALWPQGSPEDLLGSLMREGGDTDTVGAIAGAVLGARFGDAWIPVDRMVDGARLSRYAECLVSGPLPETQDAFLEQEAAYSAAEAAFRRALGIDGTAP
ncbi:Putative ADP-ribosylglycohydrolase [Minicystis rosea]|nr:Putative ADP-ribosylglycohydrolase [Minicystis rosea]